MWAEDLAPRRQIVGGHRREVKFAGGFGVFAVGGDAAQIDPQFTNLLGLGRCVDGFEEAFGGVEDALGVVVVETFHMRLAVPGITQFRCVAFLDAGKDTVEWIPALADGAGDVLGDHAQAVRRVVGVVGLIRRCAFALILDAQQVQPGAIGHLRVDDRGEKPVEGRAEQLHCLADTVPVAQCHSPRLTSVTQHVVTIDCIGHL